MAKTQNFWMGYLNSKGDGAQSSQNLADVIKALI